MEKHLKGKPYDVVYGDFLEYGGQGGNFDRIIMNPPFSKQQDIKHIMHA
jgi:16S rRNA G1207 methylase RsmC